MTDKQLHIFQKKLLTWFDKNQRKLPWRETENPYYIWISEVMLQQTQVVKVLEYYEKFIHQFPDVCSLAKASLQQVLKAWEGMGYYARARNLHKAAQVIVAEKKGLIPDQYDEFRSLPGAGEYITAAVLSQAFSTPYAVIDGNVKRVLARLFRIDTPVNASASKKIFRQYADLLLDSSKPGHFNQAMMELGATICRPKNPFCVDCPVSATCQAFTTNSQNEFPVNVQAKQIPVVRVAVGVIHKNSHILITQRKPDGLLGGLWEFPGGRLRENESSEQACTQRIKEKLNLNVAVSEFLTCVNHTYSHFKIVVDVFQCHLKSGKEKLDGPVDFRWIRIDEIDNFPFHAAHHKFIPLLKEKFESDQSTFSV